MDKCVLKYFCVLTIEMYIGMYFHTVVTDCLSLTFHWPMIRELDKREKSVNKLSSRSYRERMHTNMIQKRKNRQDKEIGTEIQGKDCRQDLRVWGGGTGVRIFWDSSNYEVSKNAPINKMELQMVLSSPCIRQMFQE